MTDLVFCFTLQHVIQDARAYIGVGTRAPATHSPTWLAAHGRNLDVGTLVDAVYLLEFITDKLGLSYFFIVPQPMHIPSRSDQSTLSF